MSKIFSSKSYVLLLFLGLSFFSCEQLIEIIKPTHPKPVADTCRIKTEYVKDYPAHTREYIYDQEGKLLRFNLGAPLSGPIVFEYNEQDQIIEYSSVYGDDNVTEFAYDSLGRLELSIERFYIGPYYYIAERTFTYNRDRILIHYLRAYEGTDILSDFQTVLVFKNDNLIRAYDLPSEINPTTFDYTYTYTNIPNRLRDQKKQLIFLLHDFTNPLMSKHLPASRRNTQGEDPGTITYNWLLNEYGYPVNNGLTNQVIYEYECEK